MKIPAAKAAVDKEWKMLETAPAWQLDNVKRKKEIILEARRNKKESPPCWYQKYNGRVVLRGDIVKDDSGSYAVFTGQGSSASQMTASKVMDVIATLPECAGPAADAVSACTQV